MSTPHINAESGTIAKVILMAGDPKRTEIMAKKFLMNVVKVSDVRGQVIYTGTYQGFKISFATSGMGMASMGIYAHELFNFYNVELIIRCGTCGSYDDNLPINSLIHGVSCYSDSGFLNFFNSNNLSGTFPKINQIIFDVAKKSNINLHSPINVFSANEFYDGNFESTQAMIQAYHLQVVEMEGYALFQTAKLFNRQAAMLLIVSDVLKFDEKNGCSVSQKLNIQERIYQCELMFKLGLESAIQFLMQK